MYKSERSFLVVWITNQVTKTYKGIPEDKLNKDTFLDI